MHWWWLLQWMHIEQMKSCRRTKIAWIFGRSKWDQHVFHWPNPKIIESPHFFWRNFQLASKNPREMEASNATMQRPNDHDLMTWTGSGQKATQCAGFGSALRECASSTSLEDLCQAARRNLHVHARKNRKRKIHKNFWKKMWWRLNWRNCDMSQQKLNAKVEHLLPTTAAPTTPLAVTKTKKKRARQFPRLRQEAYSFALGSPVESCRSPRGGSRGKKWPNNQQQEGFRLDSALFGLVSLTPDLYTPGNELSYPTEREKEKSSTQKYQKVWEYVCQFPERVLYNLQHVGSKANFREFSEGWSNQTLNPQLFDV